MFCEYCGAKLPEGAKTCPMCGNAQERKGAETSSDTTEQAAGRDTRFRGSEADDHAKQRATDRAADDRYARRDYHYEYDDRAYGRDTRGPSERPSYGASQPPAGREGFAIASLVVGILGLIISCCFPYLSLPMAIVAIVAGIYTVTKGRGGKGMAYAGIILGAITLILSIIWMAVGALFLSIFRDAM